MYYHVRDKRELLDLLIESVLAQIEVPQEGDWESRLVALYTNAWKVLVEVPGIAVLLQEHPHTAAATEMDRASRGILRESGLNAEYFDAAHAALYIHLLGSVQLAHVVPPVPRPTGQAEAFGYGLRLILAGLRHEIGESASDGYDNRSGRPGDLGVAVSRRSVRRVARPHAGVSPAAHRRREIHCGPRVLGVHQACRRRASAP